MKTKRNYLFTFLVIGLCPFILAGSYNKQVLSSFPAFEKQPINSEFLFQDMGCTVIYAADTKVALGGNNEDYNMPFTNAWFLPAEDGKYGRVYFGYEGFLWGGGMNDQGLFFDALGIDQPVAVNLEGKTRHIGSLPDKAMAECGDVDCVIDIFSRFYTLETWYHQFLFGDAHGNSVIVEPNTFLRNQKTYQIATNFYQSKTNITTCTSCERYHIANGMFENASEYSVDLIRDILNAVHAEGGYPTLYSMVYDLKERIVYLYHFHDFENVFIFKLDEELAKGFHTLTLADLFPENQEYLIWAKSELDYLAGLRESYQPVQIDPDIMIPYTGDYDLPPELGLPYPFYRIDILNGILYLKIKPDKGWLELFPLSETDFYHVSSFSQFEITFLIDSNGEVNQFLYTEAGREYTFNRIPNEETGQVTLPPTPITTAIPPTKTPTPTSDVHQASPPSLNESPVGIPIWSIVLGVAILIFLSWYLIQRNK